MIIPDRFHRLHTILLVWTKFALWVRDIFHPSDLLPNQRPFHYREDGNSNTLFRMQNHLQLFTISRYTLYSRVRRSRIRVRVPRALLHTSPTRSPGPKIIGRIREPFLLEGLLCIHQIFPFRWVQLIYIWVHQHHSGHLSHVRSDWRILQCFSSHFY